MIKVCAITDTGVTRDMIVLNILSRPIGSYPLSRGAGGFTLIELIVVITITIILAVSALPRFADTALFEERGFHDETMSLLRYAQKTAIAQHRTVCVSLNATGVTLTIEPNNPADGNCTNNTSLALPNTPRSGSGLTSSVSSFQFTPLGSTNQANNVTVNISDTPQITIEAATGYVHE
jgi:MSHA pilin protein MshC